MPNKRKLLWCIYTGVLISLFLISSTDLIIKEKKVEILPMSVVIKDASDDYYVNFKKGMEMMAEEFHSDVSFITLYAINDQEQQMELVRREIRDGVRATTLSPANEAETAMALDAISPNCPVIFLGAPVPSGSVVDTITADSFEMGQMATRMMTAQASSDIPVYLFTEGLSYGDNTNVYDGVRSMLDDHGFTYRLVEKRTDDTYRQTIEETVYPEDGRITVITLDTRFLNEASQIVDGSAVYQAHVAGLYGVGSATSIPGGLDKGIVDGLAAYSQFDMEYLSVRRAMEAIQGSRQREQTRLDAVYVNKENMQDKQCEEMFYPIE